MSFDIIVAFTINKSLTTKVPKQPPTTDVLIQFMLYLQHFTTYYYNNALSIKCTINVNWTWNNYIWIN